MTNIIGSGGVSVAGVMDEDAQYTFNLASGITAADVGKAVSIDTSAATTVKLTADTDIVLGRLETFEDRTVEGIKVGTISTEGGMKLPYSGTAPTVGVSVQGGATAGTVKTLAAAQGRSNVVTAVDTTTTTVTVLFL